MLVVLLLLLLFRFCQKSKYRRLWKSSFSREGRFLVSPVFAIDSDCPQPSSSQTFLGWHSHYFIVFTYTWVRFLIGFLLSFPRKISLLALYKLPQICRNLDCLTISRFLSFSHNLLFYFVGMESISKHYPFDNKLTKLKHSKIKFVELSLIIIFGYANECETFSIIFGRIFFYNFAITYAHPAH